LCSKEEQKGLALSHRILCDTREVQKTNKDNVFVLQVKNGVGGLAPLFSPLYRNHSIKIMLNI
jgi:hypothetical protein